MWKIRDTAAALLNSAILFQVTFEISDWSRIAWMILAQKEDQETGSGRSCVVIFEYLYAKEGTKERGGRGLDKREEEEIREMAILRCGGFTSYSSPKEKYNLSRTLRQLSNFERLR